MLGTCIGLLELACHIMYDIVWLYQPIDIIKDLSWPYTSHNFSCHSSCVIQRVWRDSFVSSLFIIMAFQKPNMAEQKHWSCCIWYRNDPNDLKTRNKRAEHGMENLPVKWVQLGEMWWNMRLFTQISFVEFVIYIYICICILYRCFFWSIESRWNICMTTMFFSIILFH